MKPQKSHIRRMMTRTLFILRLRVRFGQGIWSLERRIRRHLHTLARPGTQYRLALLLAAILSLVCGWALFVSLLPHNAPLALLQGLS